VLQRCLVRADAACGIDLARSMGWYWITRATTEGMRWLDEFLAAAATADADPQVLGWAHFMRGFLAVLKADLAAAGPPLHAAVAVARLLPAVTRAHPSGTIGSTPSETSSADAAVAAAPRLASAPNVPLIA